MAQKIKKHGKLALLVGLTLFLIVGVPFMIVGTQGANLTSMSDTLSDSTESTAANHTISFDQTGSTQFVAGETITVQFDSGGQDFDLSALAASDADDYDIVVASTEELMVVNGGCASNDAIEITTVNTSTDTLTFTACTSYTAEAASAVITIEIGTHATSGATGNSQITNPNATGTGEEFDVVIGGDFGDTGTMLVYIFDSAITVSATIAETLSVTVVGVTTANCPDFSNGAGSPTEIDTSGDANTVPFGTINTEAFYDACQDITVTTNATDGYTVTVQEDDQMTNGTDSIPDGTCDGTCNDTTANGWATATNNGLAYCMEDNVGNPAATSDAEWGTAGCDAVTTEFKTIPSIADSDTAESIMESAAEISGDQAYIGYRISADGSQPPGTYSNEVVYIATPTY